MTIHSIKVDDKMYSNARVYAKAEHRTIASQITYWAELGKLAVENPDLPVSFIKDVLLAKSLQCNSEPFEFRTE